MEVYSGTTALNSCLPGPIHNGKEHIVTAGSEAKVEVKLAIHDSINTTDVSIKTVEVRERERRAAGENTHSGRSESFGEFAMSETGKEVSMTSWMKSWDSHVICSHAPGGECNTFDDHCGGEVGIAAEGTAKKCPTSLEGIFHTDAAEG